MAVTGVCCKSVSFRVEWLVRRHPVLLFSDIYRNVLIKNVEIFLNNIKKDVTEVQRHG